MKNQKMQNDKKDLFCKVSLEDQNEWFHGIISYTNLKKEIVEVFLSAKHMREYFKEGSKVIVKSLNDDNEFLFTGFVTKKVLSIRKQAMIIKIDQIKKFFNLRRSERFHVRYPATMSLAGGEPYPAILNDISTGGALLTSSHLFSENERVNIQVNFSSTKALNFSGNILRKQQNIQTYKYGLSIDSIDDTNHHILRELIDFLTIQKNYLAHEWKIFKRIKYTVYTLTVLLIFFVVFVILAAEGM